MLRWRRLLFAAVLASFAAVPAGAQVAGHPYSLSAGAGIVNFDSRDDVKNAAALDVAAGWRWSDYLTFQASFLRASAKHRDAGAAKHDASDASFDALWMLRDPAEKATPYLLTGMGLGRSNDDANGFLRAGAPSLGFGFRFNVSQDPRAYVRLQARDVMFREPNATQFSSHVALTAAFEWVLGGRVKDQDRDGVRNGLDRCPNTPLGARVDAHGCPLDGDGDGVFDGLDKCPDTPKGCKVDATGCSIDSDGDGVCDGIDQCPNTPKGATVDAKGCPMDSDGDGVFDGLDQCPGTPKGAKVDDKGCPIDSDGDGVYDGLDQCPDTPKGAKVDDKGCPIDSDGDGIYDGLDQCPDTPKGLKVDSHGCPIEVIERETELLDTGLIRLNNVNFETAKANILPEAFPTLDAVGAVLIKWPQLKIEIGGHTDSRGRAPSNLKLSEARADSVRAYVMAKYPQLDPAQFTVKGYGQTKPVASNKDDLGRAKNRRVEFVVLNKDVLKKEIEKRHLMQQNEGAPADTTKKP